MELTAYGITDVGQVRPHNEDSILLEPALHLYAVADGMGGHKAGEFASRICLDTLKDYLQMAVREGQASLVDGIDEAYSEAANLLRSAVGFANRAVFEASCAKPEWRGMGTTVVALTVSGSRIAIAHVGDSRAYLLRGDRFEQLTGDHSWVEEQVRAGLMTRDEALRAKGRNVLTRAIGQDEKVAVDLGELEIQAGDYLLLCSDGLFGMVADEEIAALIRAEKAPETACRELVACANGRGGRDNISVVLVAVAAEKGFFAGLKRVFVKP